MVGDPEIAKKVELSPIEARKSVRRRDGDDAKRQ
jgi:hypothetical protein